MTLLFVPGPPAIVPELSPTDTAAATVRTSVHKVLDQRQPGAIDVVGARDQSLYTAHTGSFRAWGVDVTVGFGNYLPELIAAYLLGPAWSGKVADSRSRIGQPAPGRLTVVVLDGSAGLDPRAPLSLVETAPAIHRACGELLAGKLSHPWDEITQAGGGEFSARMSNLEGHLREGGIIDPRLWVEAACLLSQHTGNIGDAGAGAASESTLRCRLLNEHIAHGVGRFVAVWELPRFDSHHVA